jgi:flavin reductase (DIM6/NTAB) family NADH-FMN oxidoreductase RutF
MSDDPIKDALKLIPYGFHSLTSRHGDDVNAMVFNWFSQVSFEPRLVAVGLQKDCYSHGLIEKEGVFAVNIFREEDKEAIMPLTKGRAKKPNKMQEVSYKPGPETGCPVLDGAAAYLECKVSQIVDIGGDHDIVVAEVINAGLLKEADLDDILTLPKIGWSYAG